MMRPILPLPRVPFVTIDGDARTSAHKRRSAAASSFKLKNSASFHQVTGVACSPDERVFVITIFRR